MSERHWACVAAKSASEVGTPKILDKQARALLRPQQTPRDFVEALVAAEDYSQAIRFLAHALPKREAVWWACRCVRQALAPEAPPEVTAAFLAAERWVLDPTDENRRAALAAAEAEGYESAAGLAAAAAGWSGGNLAPAGLPPVAPAGDLTARAVAGAVAMAAIDLDPDEIPATLQALIARGAGVAEGTDRWEEGSGTPFPAPARPTARG